MNIKKLPTQECLKEAFDYHPDGYFIRKISPRGKSKIGGIVREKPNTAGYRPCSVESTRYLLHRLIFMWHHGWCPPMIDHRDRDRLNNRIGNLRPTTISQNNHNTRVRSDSTTGVRNIFPHTRGGFRVEVKKDRVAHTKRCHSMPKAIIIRDQMRSQLGLQPVRER